MATTPKNTPATVGSAPVEPAPENKVVAPRAVFVTHRASADDAMTPADGGSPTAEGEPTPAGPAPIEAAPENEIVAPRAVFVTHRAAAADGVRSRAAFTEAKTAADAALNTFEDSFAAAKDGMIAINAKAFEALRASMAANFDFAKASFGVRSLPDLFALQSEFARRQFDVMTAQTRDIHALAQKAAIDVMGPLANPRFV